MNKIQDYLYKLKSIEKKAGTFFFTILVLVLLSLVTQKGVAQITYAARSGFTWIPTENVTDKDFGSGYTLYSAAWPVFNEYPGARNFQMGLAGCWMTTQRTGNEPDDFYTTIEGGLGWWHDTRFATKVPKFIMGGVSWNFFSWANGPGAGRGPLLSNGQRDWSVPGGKYGVAQISNRLLWAPDGLNMAQSVNGEMLGYGYNPLPLSSPVEQTNGQDIKTGNQYWTLFLNSTNFKGPATCFLPTFWTKPVLENPSLEGLFLDSRPSEPNVGFGIEHAESPALAYTIANGDLYTKQARLQYPVSDENNSILLNQISVYSKGSLWTDMEAWFNGGAPVMPESMQSDTYGVNIVNNGGAKIGEFSILGEVLEIEMDYLDNIQQTQNIMGYEYNLDVVERKDNNFIMPEYFKLKDNKMHHLDKSEVPNELLNAEVPIDPRPGITYLTPLDPECQFQDPNGAWNNPGPTAGPFTADLGDGSTVTYYWYKFIDQPSIIQANLPEDVRNELQSRVELIHTNWGIDSDYMAPPENGTIATVDPAAITHPPAGLEVGYVPIVTRQEKSKPKLRVFVLAGQSNMEGFGSITDTENDPGTLIDVIQKDEAGNWSQIGEPGNWNSLEDASIYFANDGDTIRTNITVGQGNNPNLIGPELMFAHQLDDYYEDPILIIKTAWGGKSLAVDFRPPSAGGITGEFYTSMIETVQYVTQNINTEFPNIEVDDYELSGFAWFQGWNDGASDSFLEEYESNLSHLVADVRNDLGYPDLPFVIANSGHGGYEAINDQWVRSMQEQVSVAQETVGCNDELYGGRVGFVQTKDFYIASEESPFDGIHHFHNNALTFLNIGKEIGNEMILAINDMAYCYEDCANQTSPGVVSIGNKVWHDLNQNGINDPGEPGIPGVSLALWYDSDGDDIPDWQGFGGIQVTDEDGYYSFSGLVPGVYSVFVWSVDNWGEGEPLHGFVSTGGFEANANNDVDNDNNGSGVAETDIFAGIVHLSSGEEPLGDGDEFNCFFDYDASGNNTVDFGFFDPNFTSTNITNYSSGVHVFPNPALNEVTIEGELTNFKIEMYDAMGRLHQTIQTDKKATKIDISLWPKGLYLMKIINTENKLVEIQNLVKQ